MPQVVEVQVGAPDSRPGAEEAAAGRADPRAAARNPSGAGLREYREDVIGLRARFADVAADGTVNPFNRYMTAGSTWT